MSCANAAGISDVCRRLQRLIHKQHVKSAGFVLIAVLFASTFTGVPSVHASQALTSTSPKFVYLPLVALLDPPFVADSFITGIDAQAVQVLARGRKRGNNPHSFSLIGDSNTANPRFFKPIGNGVYELAAYAFLRPSIPWFQGSFGRVSLAASGGYSVSALLNMALAPPQCPGVAPLECELSTNNPAFALIMIGTGDQYSWQDFEVRFRNVLSITLSHDVLPVVVTKGDTLECTRGNAPCGTINDIQRRLAAEYHVPLLDLDHALDGLPDHGMIIEGGVGFHYSFPADDDQPLHYRTALFYPDLLNYGFNVRNLQCLWLVETLRRQLG